MLPRTKRFSLALPNGCWSLLQSGGREQRPPLFEKSIFIFAFPAQDNFEPRSAAYSVQHLRSRIVRIGIVPAFDPGYGGVYQYSMTMLHAFCEWKRKAGDVAKVCDAVHEVHS